MPTIDPLAIHQHLRRAYVRTTHGGTRRNDVEARSEIIGGFTQYLSNLKAEGIVADYEVACNSSNNPVGSYPSRASVRIKLSNDLDWNIKFPSSEGASV